MSRVACPTPDVLQQLVLGFLPAEEVEPLATHVEQCASCSDVLQTLNDSDALTDDLRRPVQDTTPADVVSGLVERLSLLVEPSPASATGIVGGLPPMAPAGELTEEALTFLAPPQQGDEIGRLGPYRILRVLGQGGMGIVFLAEERQLQRLVALKVLRPALAASPAARQRFLREARAAAAIVDDHVVTVLQVGEDQNLPYLAMQLLEGETLEARLQREGRLPPEEALRIGQEIAHGLAAAHERGLVHRDIKPSNIFLENLSARIQAPSLLLAGQEETKKVPELSRVKLLDFGLTRAAGGGDLTREGLLVGTPAYMAPEQARGQEVDARSDLFSLGCLLYHILSGRKPFEGGTTMAILRALELEEPPPLHEVAPVPLELSRLVHQLLAKNPAQRPASAHQVADALSAGNASESLPSRTTQRASLNRWRVGLSVLGLGLLLAGVLFLRLRTAHGTLEIEVNEPGAVVQILNDNDEVEITRPAGNGTVRIAVDPGKHRLRVKKDGFRLYTTAFAVESEQTLALSARLVPNAADPAPGDGEEPWQALFNGKDLTGWKTHPRQPGNWRVENGLLVGSGATSHLFSERGDFGDFHARMKVKINDGGNSGLFFRTAFSFNAIRFPRSSGYEAQIYQGEDEYRTGSLVPFHPTHHECDIRSDRWFLLEVVARANHILIKVDGKTTVDYVDPKWSHVTGHFAIQCWNENYDDQDTVVQVESIEVKKLKGQQ